MSLDGYIGIDRKSGLVPEDIRLYTFRVRFEWDPRRAEANLHGHGIRFAEAVTVWRDAFALTREDPDALGEHRFEGGL